MIQRFVIGKPFPTESVVLDLPAETGPVPYLTPDGDGWQYVMQEKDIVYGLGEMPRGLNKRGWHYETNNTDESEHGENRLSYYAAHNFLLISPADGSGCIGIFVDFPGKVSYDIGYTRHDTLRFATAEPNYALYLITAPTAAEVAKEFRQLIGPSYIPPKWAFGLAQRRFGYKTEADIREVAAQYKANGLPLDMICMDIDYMQSYADFTIDKARFPDLGKLAADLKAEGIRLVPIIDAGIRCDDNDPVCHEGLEKGYFCTKEDGTPFVAAVWPGKAYFTDFLRPEARAWFGRQYKVLTDLGIEGFWNDMNEPALFYSPERLKAFFENAAALSRKDNLDQNDFFGLVRSVMGLMNAPRGLPQFLPRYRCRAGAPRPRPQPLRRLHDPGCRRGVPDPASRPAHPALLPQQHHRRPPLGRDLAGRQPLLVEPAAGQHPDDACRPDVRLPLQRCRFVRFQ